MPREQSELCYVAPAKWTAIRRAVAREFYEDCAQVMLEA
jgi:hypothetical protein